MTTFQLLLFIIAGFVFYLFFKQLFSGNHPKRGIDFEAKVADAQIGGINRPDKIFSEAVILPSRIEELETMADEAIEKRDFEEAQKALGSALIIDAKNSDILYKIAYVSVETKNYNEAKEYYHTLIALDHNDDMAQVLLANTLHKLDENDEAIKAHEKAIALDDNYAPHYFNYANTLYDLEKTSEALTNYSKAYALDDSLEVAKEMIEKLKANDV